MLSCSFLPPWNILGLPRFVGKRQYCFLSYYPGGSVNQPMLSPCPLWRAHCTQMTAFRIDSCHSLLLDTSHHLYLCPVFFSCVLKCGPPTDCHPGSWAWETWEGFWSKPTLTLEFPFLSTPNYRLAPPPPLPFFLICFCQTSCFLRLHFGFSYLPPLFLNTQSSSWLVFFFQSFRLAFSRFLCLLPNCSWRMGKNHIVQHLLWVIQIQRVKELLNTSYI